MTDPIAYRGPDDAGAWHDAGAGVGLGHRRLSIVDLSPEGHQPMPSASGRYVVAFNGEVYNFEHVRRAAERAAGPYPYRGHSDTEVLLAAFEAWGVEGALPHFVGMFALAVWDREDRALWLVRDRLGIKPLYYGTFGAGGGDVLAFGSELKALTGHPAFDGALDRDAAAAFLRLSYIPAPRTIYRGVRKLRPGHALRVTREGRALRLDERPFWRLEDVVTDGLRDPFRGSDADAVDGLEALAREAVGLRMVADVPLGAFLSGGVDSSLVVALMQAQSARPVRTFSVGFDDRRYDEAPHAKAVAQHLGTDHTELYVSERDVADVVPRLGAMYDEPFADASQIPTFLVSDLARRSVTVALSGDGGDELFAGYNRHRTGPRLWRLLRAWPLPARRAAARLLERLAATRDGRLVDALNERAPAALRVATPTDKLVKLAGVLDAASEADLYDRLVSTWAAGPAAVAGGHGLPPERPAWTDALAGAERMMALDALTYLPDDVLTKVDRASMAVSLEARVPLLDHRLVAFAWRLPLGMKLRGGVTKWALREVLYRHVPRALIERPKAGFAIPIGAYLRGPLRAWADDLLDPGRLAADDLLDAGPVRRLWAEHFAGRPGRETALWNVLMLQAWQRARAEAPVPAHPEPA